MQIRVLIADDRPRARRSLKALLTAMHWSAPSHDGHLPVEVVGEAENGQEAIELVGVHRPNVVVMDLQPHTASAPKPRLDGTATIRMIKRRWPAIRVVVLTMYAADRAPVISAGADAFLLKGCSTQELLDAVIPRGEQE